MMTACLQAVETAPVQVIRIIDGDTIDVAADLGGTIYEVRVRLLWVNTAERGNPGYEAATEALRVFCGNEVILFDPRGNSWERGNYGRLLALVRQPGTDETAQEMLMREGHSLYWTKYSRAPEAWESRFLKLR